MLGLGTGKKIFAVDRMSVLMGCWKWCREDRSCHSQANRPRVTLYCTVLEYWAR